MESEKYYKDLISKGKLDGVLVSKSGVIADDCSVLHLLVLADDLVGAEIRIKSNPEELKHINSLGQTALKCICSSEFTDIEEMVKLLIQKGSQIGDSLNRAIMSGSATKELVEIFLEKGCSINASALDCILEKKAFNKELLEFIAPHCHMNSTIKDVFPLEKAAASLDGKELDDAVEILMKFGAKVNLVKNSRLLTLSDSIQKAYDAQTERIAGLEKCIIDISSVEN